MSHVSLKDLPISDSQKAQIASLLPLLPKAESMITQAQGLVGPVSWILGVGQQRRFLIQTMDSAELRPGGGFTGQYGVFQIQDGRMSRLRFDRCDAARLCWQWDSYWAIRHLPDIAG